MATTFNFRDYILYLQQIGFYDVFLPFLLVFAIVFAVLEKTKIFGERGRVNLIIALVIALLLVVQRDIVNTINTFLPSVSLILVIVLAFLLVLTMVAGKEFKGLGGSAMGVAVIAIIIALALALSPRLPNFLAPSEREALLRIAIPVGIVLLAAWYVGGGKKEEKEKNWLEKLGEGILNK